METKPFNLKKEAQRVFDSVLLDEPLNFVALYGKALTLYQDWKLEECLEVMNKAIEVESDECESNVKDVKIKIEKLAKLNSVSEQQKSGQNRFDLLKAQLLLRNPIAGHKIGMRPAEPKNKTHLCKICDKTFTKTFSLNRHMQLHTGEKPHKCGHCRKAFIQKTDMLRHETTHSDTLNFQCNLCEKRFKTKKNLSCHLITHSVDRPFKCRFCEKDFKVKRLWRFHEGLHKDTKP
jgi:hypothetical protein